MFSPVCDLIPIVNPHPKDGCNMLLFSHIRGAIHKNYRLFLFRVGEFQVIEKVADLLLAFHSERNHPVAGTPVSQYKRELESGSIQYKSTGRLLQRHIRGPWKDFDRY